MKFKKKIAFIVGTILTLLLILIYISFNGNFISNFLVSHCAEDYLEEKYSQYDYQLQEVQYSFKDGLYYAKIISPTSEDSRFSISYDWLGNLQWDSYESDVLEKFNTIRRIDEQYRKYTDHVLLSPQNPLPVTDICFGSVQELDECEKMEDGTLLYEPFGIDISKLKLDQIFDNEELGRQAGYLVIYLEDDDISVEKTMQMLLELRNYMDEKNVSFCAVDFHLRRPNDYDEAINLIKFKYDDIYEMNLKERVEKSMKQTEYYYQDLDNQKQKEIEASEAKN